MFTFPAKDTLGFCQHLIRIWVGVCIQWSGERIHVVSWMTALTGCVKDIDEMETWLLLRTHCIAIRWLADYLAVWFLLAEFLSFSRLTQTRLVCAVLMCWCRRWQGFCSWLPRYLIWCLGSLWLYSNCDAYLRLLVAWILTIRFVCQNCSH